MLVAAAPLVSIFSQPVGWGPRVVIVVLVVLSAVSPFDSLLTLSSLGPFAATILALTRTGSVPVNFSEAMVLAVLCGFAIRLVVRPRPVEVSSAFGIAAGLLLSLALASFITSAIIVRVERPDTTLLELVRLFILRDYLVTANTLTAAMLFAEGVALTVVVAHVCARDSIRQTRLLEMTALGAAAAALLNLLRVINSAVGQPHPWLAFLKQFATIRTNMHFPDLNAAGSYFVLSLFIALGIVQSSRARSLVASLLVTAGLWIAGSRTALAAGMGVGSIGMFWRPGVGRQRATLSVAIVAVVAVLALVIWRWYPVGRNLESGGAVSYRITTAKAAISLIVAHPTFGVGAGNFYSVSGLSDNAHNNYLQIAAELGFPALALFLWIAFLAVRASWRLAGRSWPAWGVTAGVVAYLVTCLTGHPLLVAGAAYPFWIALGLAASFEDPPQSAVGVRRVGMVAAIILGCLLPFHIAAATRDADVEHASVGFSKWQQQPDGSRYRWAGGRATFYVSPAARSVRIPLRRGSFAPADVEVRIYLDGIEANRVMLASGEEGATVRLNLFRRSKTRFARIDLEARIPGTQEPLNAVATDAGGVLAVGRPILEN
jgi:O-antigen ligase